MGGGQAVVPEPMGEHRDIRRGMRMEACGKADPRLVLLDESLVPAFGGLMNSEPSTMMLVPRNGLVRLTLPSGS
jgi:hypothetical protein